ncbi:MAG: helix-turn-helix transcriptional regulator [Ruminococcaceae bacterium]|nr:helix-turn-helix transcriptional regulator [Oscillospiraceae bacterium]
MKKTLHENIRLLRMARGMNQVEFAKHMNVTKQCVSNWENDNVLPSIEMLMRIADFFNVTTDSLLGRSTDKTLDISKLTDIQIAHLQLLVSDFLALNKHNKS